MKSNFWHYNADASKPPNPFYHHFDVVSVNERWKQISDPDGWGTVVDADAFRARMAAGGGISPEQEEGMGNRLL